MKPHIRKHNSLWYCAALFTGRVGIGYTAASAYADWLAMHIKDDQRFGE